MNKLAMAGVLGLASGTCLLAAHCAALQQDARIIAPGLESGCSFLEGASGDNPWVDFACMGAEAADRLIATYPAGAASRVSSNTLIAPDGGAIATTYRVRLRFRFVTDAGTGDAARD